MHEHDFERVTRPSQACATVENAPSQTRHGPATVLTIGRTLILAMSTPRLRDAGHLPSLIAALAYFDVSFMVWVLLGALGPVISTDLGLSPFEKGLMVAVPALSGAGARLVLGSLVDRIGITRTGLVALALTLVPLAWGALAGGSYAQVLGVGVLLGIAGGSFAVALPLASRWYPPELQGIALGIAGAGNSGTVVAALVAPRIAAHWGWHATFAVMVLPVVAVWTLFALIAREPPGRDRAVGSPGALAMLREADARRLCSWYLVTFGGFVGLSAYLSIFFVDRFGVAPVTASTYGAGCAVAGSLLRPVGGALADRLGGARVLVAAFAGVGMSGALLATMPSFGVAVVLLAALLGIFGVGNGAVFQLAGRRFPTSIGAVTGLVGAAGGVGGFLLPFGMGALYGATSSFATGFVVIAAVGSGAAWGTRRVLPVWDRAGRADAVTLRSTELEAVA